VKKALREHLSTTCSEQELKRWFDPLEIDNSGVAVRVRFPHSFFAQWFAGRMQDRFEAELHRFLAAPCEILYLAGGKPLSAIPQENSASPSTSLGNTPGEQHNSSQQQRSVLNSKRLAFPFDPQYTFDSFLTNSKNFFPLETARQVARGGDAQFNPFVICGKSGSGKSHLLKAIANDISKSHPTGSILATTGEGLKDLLFQNGNSDVLSARAFIASHSFLLVDDINWLAGDVALQQEMLVLFNMFQDQGRQMVFTCADRIAAHEDLSPTLRSRLEGGLVVSLKQPDLEVRAQFVHAFVRAKKLPVSKEQILTLAQRFQNFRALGGILVKLVAFRELVRKDISPRDFEQIITNTEERDQPAISTDTVISVVCEHYQVNQKDVLGEDRRQSIALARQVSMFLCRQLLGLSYPALGRAFGGKDHSTVIYSVKKIQDMQTDDKVMKQVLKDLKLRCRQPG